MKYFRSFIVLSLQNSPCILHLWNNTIQMLKFFLKILNLYLDFATFTGNKISSNTHIVQNILNGLPFTEASVSI